MRILNRDLSIPPNQLVYGLVYHDDKIGDVYMPDIYTTHSEAFSHWRFTAPWLDEKEKQNVEVLEMPYGDLIKLAFDLNPANPFEMVANDEFHILYGMRWRINK